ncbi:hypothetical protein D3C80_1224370 [compost metagenome]
MSSRNVIGGSEFGRLHIYHGDVLGLDLTIGPYISEVLEDIRKFFSEGRQELVILKFSHFNGFNSADGREYLALRDGISNYLDPWLYKTKPENRRLADVTLGEYLNSGNGRILVAVDGDFALNYKKEGFWVYRDWNSGDPEKGDITVFDQYSNKILLDRMKNDQLEKLRNFDGKCENDRNIPCDLFLLSWTLTPPTAVWTFAQEADRILGREMMRHRSPNQHGYFANLLYLDYFQYARPAFISDVLLRSCNSQR